MEQIAAQVRLSVGFADDVKTVVFDFEHDRF